MSMSLRTIVIVLGCSLQSYGWRLQTSGANQLEEQVGASRLGSLASYLLAGSPVAGRGHSYTLNSRASHINRAVSSPQMNTFDPLVSRRSVVKYDTAKAVPEEVTNRALEAAILAPNHFMSEPWRFYACGPVTKEKLCGLNEDKRKMAEGVPEMLVVTISSEHDLSEKLGLEDHAAVSASIQNFMLSLAADGVGSKWMTGALGAPPEDVLAAIGAPDGEKLMGVIWYGYPAKPLEETKSPPRKKGLEAVLNRLP